jgi:hypothetical protein
MNYNFNCALLMKFLQIFRLTASCNYMASDVLEILFGNIGLMLLLVMPLLILDFQDSIDAYRFRNALAIQEELCRI